MSQLTSASESDLRVLCARVMGETQVLYNYRPLWLNGLEIDIYYPTRKLAIEYNGSQHYRRSALQSGRQLGKVQERDERKAQILEAKGIKLLIVTDKDFRNEEALETRILEVVARG